MKHYFYFKKNQMVPQWLMRQRDADTLEVLPMATFKVNGKLMVDDKTGSAIIWPANRRFQHIINVYGFKRSVLLDTDDADSINSLFGYLDRQRVNDQRTSPLTNARRHGFDVRSTTKCLPIPENFSRLQSIRGSKP